MRGVPLIGSTTICLRAPFTLERLRAYEAPSDSGQSLHFFIEATRRAYAERLRNAGIDIELKIFPGAIQKL